MEIIIHAIKTDGLPPDTDDMTGKVAFVFDGCVVSGWPLPDQADGDGEVPWEANSDVGNGAVFWGVTTWVEFPVPVWELER